MICLSSLCSVFNEHRLLEAVFFLTNVVAAQRRLGKLLGRDQLLWHDGVSKPFVRKVRRIVNGMKQIYGNNVTAICCLIAVFQ